MAYYHVSQAIGTKSMAMKGKRLKDAVRKTRIIG